MINSSEVDTKEVLQQNELTVLQTSIWINDHSGPELKFFIIEAKKLPKRHAGVGLARKIGMDEAVVRFDRNFNENGIISCFDADCKCDPNYLIALESHFASNPQAQGCSVYYEHPLIGNEFEASIYEGIVDYELFLRYYNQGLRFAGFPFAFHTVGSAMAVTSKVYQKQGGMNKRKAGEDFYFLQKIIYLGNFTELNTTRIIPSPRTSNRVPFGTGKAILKWLEKKELITYDPQVFWDLKLFISELPQLFCDKSATTILSGLSPALKSFLISRNFENKVREIKANSSSQLLFEKRFFQWFNGFVVLKFVHFARDNYYKPIKIGSASSELLTVLGFDTSGFSRQEILVKYRAIEKIADNSKKSDG